MLLNKAQLVFCFYSIITSSSGATNLTENRASTHDSCPVNSENQTDTTPTPRVSQGNNDLDNGEGNYVMSRPVQNRNAPSVLVSHNETFSNNLCQEPNMTPVPDSHTHSTHVMPTEEESQNRQPASRNEVEPGRHPLIASINHDQEQPRHSSSNINSNALSFVLTSHSASYFSITYTCLFLCSYTFVSFPDNFILFL